VVPTIHGETNMLMIGQGAKVGWRIQCDIDIRNERTALRC